MAPAGSVLCVWQHAAGCFLRQSGVFSVPSLSRHQHRPGLEAEAELLFPPKIQPRLKLGLFSCCSRSRSQHWSLFPHFPAKKQNRAAGRVQTCSEEVIPQLPPQGKPSRHLPPVDKDQRPPRGGGVLTQVVKVLQDVTRMIYHLLLFRLPVPHGRNAQESSVLLG